MAPSPTPSSGPPVDLAGRLLASRYRLNRRIAAGGMAEVWEATDQVLTRRVAVKLLHAHLANDDSFVKRFRAEAIAAARLAHPSIVSVYDTFSEDGLEAIVMELVVGTTMRADLDQHGPLKLDAVLAIGSQVADALGAAHASGLVHRDVKPANILLSADGRVLVADFGIAKAAEGSDLTSDGSMVGTAKYLAPEQVEGTALDGRADLYALGVVLYEALTGTPPFTAETDVGTAMARLTRDARPPRQVRPEISPSVEAVVMKAMARRREDRYPDARAMRTALLDAGADPTQAPAAASQAAAHASGEHPITGPPSHPPAHPPAMRPPPRPNPPPSPEPVGPATDQQPPRRRRGRLLLMLLVVAVLGAGLAALVMRNPDPAQALTISSAVPFDPLGTGPRGENDDLAPRAIDQDPASVWQTEPYNTADLTKLRKGGVGLALELDHRASVSVVHITSPDSGWSATIYAHVGAAPSDLSGWGDPVGKVTDAGSGDIAIDTSAGSADRILVWLTYLPGTDRTHVMHVGNVEIDGRA